MLKEACLWHSPKWLNALISLVNKCGTHTPLLCFFLTVIGIYLLQKACVQYNKYKFYKSLESMVAVWVSYSKSPLLFLCFMFCDCLSQLGVQLQSARFHLVCDNRVYCLPLSIATVRPPAARCASSAAGSTISKVSSKTAKHVTTGWVLTLK